MKLKKTFLFFLLALLNLTLVYCQQKQDSLPYYYALSKDSKHTIEEKLGYVGKVIRLAKSKNNYDYELKGYNRKSYLLGNLKHYDSAIVNANLLLAKSIKLSNSKYILKANRKLGDYHRLNDSLLLAFKYYKAHKNFSLVKGDTLSVITNLRWIASIEKKFDVPYESQSSAVEALSLIDNIKNKNAKIIEAEIGLYNHLGLIYGELDNYEKGLESYNKVIEITTNLEHKSIARNNKGNIYKAQEKYELALKEFDYAYQSSLNTKDEKQKSRYLSNLGLVKSKLNLPDALLNIKDALALRVQEDYKLGMYSSYMHLSEYYSDRKDTKEALSYTNKAYNLSLQLNSESDQVEALGILIDLGDNSKVKEYKSLVSTVFKLKQLNSNKFASTKYNYYKNERALKEAALESKNQKSFKLIYLLLSIIILSVSVFLYFILKAKHRKQKRQEIYNTETRISKTVHDEVANDIYHVMTKLQSGNDLNEEVLDDMESIYNRTRDISNQNSAIVLNDTFDTILSDLLLNYKSETVSIITKDLSKITWDAISNTKKKIIYRVLQELMVNMKKHSEATIVVLKFRKQGRKISIDYKDNGKGLPIKKGNGLANVESRIKSINGTFTFESENNKGFKATIRI
ncbi:ATP-binding protein [Lacinutrix sp. Bg11-31]|uniref:tetratricopeptide repeat-containing sensor histidine kinase n=1 Tax=Lacinutrix sp. Bg11-31 TaxID=2057808 RepID=UPI000C31433F|nr:ATP-binding protein [Lacinutrix sp. Bg11-31]AUC81717.1 ATP-binding protein [Lacinutrix sp. Bg11-31]